jgi:hypothetical protein
LVVGTGIKLGAAQRPRLGGALSTQGRRDGRT